MVLSVVLPTTKLHTPSFFYKKEQKCHLISSNSINIWYSSISKPSMVVYFMTRIHFWWETKHG